MRYESHIVLREDKQLIVLTHLSQLVVFVIGFGSLILPLILWLVNKDKIYQMDEHGKHIVNFQLSILIYSIICIPLIFIGIGILGILALLVISLVFPIINAVKASNGETPKYPLSLSFIS